MTLVRFIKNSRNNDTLIAGDFIFRRNKCRDEKVYWKCRKANCPAKITTHNGKVMGHFLKHNHDDTNQEEITRLEGLSPPTNYQQIAQDEEVSQQVLVNPAEPFAEYSFNSSGSSYMETSAEDPQLQCDHNQQEASTSKIQTNSSSTSSSLQSAVKEISESQKKIEELVNNLISSTESDSLQTENLRLKVELEQVVRDWSTEMEAKELRLQEETRKAEQVQKYLESQLNSEREEKQKLELENEQLKQLIQQYEIQNKEEEEQTYTLEEVTDQLCHSDDV